MVNSSMGNRWEDSVDKGGNFGLFLLILQWKNPTSSTWRSVTGCWKLNPGLAALIWRHLPPWCPPQSINPWVKVWDGLSEEPLLTHSLSKSLFWNVLWARTEIISLSSEKWEKLRNLIVGKSGMLEEVLHSYQLAGKMSDFIWKLPCSCLNFFFSYDSVKTNWTSGPGWENIEHF